MKPYWPQKLYYSATAFLMVRDEEERANTCMTPYSLTLELGENTEKKFEAFRTHSTQAVLLDQAQHLWEPSAGFEHYLLVAARGLKEAGADKSIFQGVVDD
jgi:hypothetical protein